MGNIDSYGCCSNDTSTKDEITINTKDAIKIVSRGPSRCIEDEEEGEFFSADNVDVKNSRPKSGHKRVLSDEANSIFSPQEIE